MSEIMTIVTMSIYLLGAVFFVFVSKKCFMEGKSVKKLIACFFLSPSIGYFCSDIFSINCFGDSYYSGNQWAMVAYVLFSAGLQIIVQAVMLFFYIKLMRPKNASVAVFMYLCSVMLVPNLYFWVTTSTVLPFFLYIFLHVLFYFSTVKPLSGMTRKRLVTNPKLFVILPLITFAFNTLLLCMYYYTIMVYSYVENVKDEWIDVLHVENETLLASAKKVYFYFYQYLQFETEIILYPTIFDVALLIISFSVIVRNIKFMNEVVEAQKEIKELSVEVMEALAHTIDAKDEYTKGHSIRVAKYSRMIAGQMGLSEEKCESVYYMGLLHDLGKIGVPNEIINKPGPLTDVEYDVIKGHPATGFDILAEIKSRPDLATGARWHHERYDGTGYPDHKKGEEIPLEARIIAVADTYDAMTSNRSYRSYLPQATVRAEIERCIGTQFDEEPARAMIALIDQDKEYKMHE